MESLSWPVWFNDYNTEVNIPLTLADWGHSWWKVWLMMRAGYSRQNYGNCPTCRKLIKNDPQINYIAKDMLEQGFLKKETVITVGRVPNFVTPDLFKSNFMDKLKISDHFKEIIVDNDKDSVWEEKIFKIVYKVDVHKTIMKKFKGHPKILSISTNQMHSMINVTSWEDPNLHKDVKNILKAKNYDLVMLLPNKPSFGYNISLIGDVNLLENFGKRKYFKGELSDLVKSRAVIISKNFAGKAYLVLFFIEQEDMLRATELLLEGVKINDVLCNINKTSDNDSFGKYEITLADNQE